MLLLAAIHLTIPEALAFVLKTMTISIYRNQYRMLKREVSDVQKALSHRVTHVLSLFF